MVNNKNLGWFACLSGLGAALIAALCCVGPVVLAALGLSTAFLWLSAYHNVFLIGAFILVGVSVFFIWRKKDDCCEIDQEKTKKKGKLILALLTLVTFGIFYVLLFQVIGPWIYEKANAQVEQSSPTQSNAIEIVNFSIPSMDCPACALNIQNQLNKTPGIQKAKVSFEDKTAQIVYDPYQITSEVIKQIIDETSFPATIEHR